jgi:hypothetical protein
MFFDDDAGDGVDDSSGTADESSESTASKRARQLAREADGDSVTAARLDGDERYFPNSLAFLQADQQPRHLLLLTTSGNAFDVHAGSRSGEVPTEKLDAVTGGVAVFTTDAVLVVVDDCSFEMPYAAIDATQYDDYKVVLYATGREYRLYTADSADDAEVAAAYDYLRRQVRERTA